MPDKVGGVDLTDDELKGYLAGFRIVDRAHTAMCRALGIETKDTNLQWWAHRASGLVAAYRGLQVEIGRLRCLVGTDKAALAAEINRLRTVLCEIANEEHAHHPSDYSEEGIVDCWVCERIIHKARKAVNPDA